MKSTKEVIKEVAEKLGFDPDFDVELFINEAMQEYAKQCCDEQIKACAENAELEIYCQHGYGALKQDSILNIPNIVTTK